MIILHMNFFLNIDLQRRKFSEYITTAVSHYDVDEMSKCFA